MPIKQTPLKTIQVRQICDVCGKGDYLPTGTAFASNPMQYPHKCNVCSDKKIFTEKYPIIRSNFEE